MRTKTFFLIILISLANYALAQFGAKVAKLHQEFTISYGQNVYIREIKLIIKFVSVKEDSRCPENVQCISAGNAKIRLKLMRTQTRAIMFAELNTTQHPQEFNYKRYNIKFINLTPHPQAGQKIHLYNYKATLVVSNIYSR